MAARDGKKKVSFRTIPLNIWTRPWFRNLDLDSSFVFQYLLTCPHNHMSGICRMPIGYVAADLPQIETQDRIVRSLNTLERNGRIEWDRENEVIWVIDMANFCVNHSKTTATNLAGHLETLEDSNLADRWVQRYGDLLVPPTPNES